MGMTRKKCEKQNNNNPIDRMILGRLKHVLFKLKEDSKKREVENDTSIRGNYAGYILGIQHAIEIVKDETDIRQ